MSLFYFHAPPWLRFTFFNNAIISLDLKKNVYGILPHDLSNHLHLFLHHPFKKTNSFYLPVKSGTIGEKDLFDTFSFLSKEGFLLSEPSHEPYLHPFHANEPSSGAANIDWRLDYTTLLEKEKWFHVLEAYGTLAQVLALSNGLGFYSLIKSLIKRKPIEAKEVSSQAFLPLVRALNQACFYFPVRIKCLEWSVALCFMAFRRGFQCHMEIGVQNMPFMAHAWVRCGEEVIADSPDLPEDLSIILKEPWGKG